MRRYADGVVAFDPIDGRTYSFPVETFEVIEAIAGLVGEGADSRAALLDAARSELGLPRPTPGEEDDPSEANLRQWVDISLRLNGR